MTTRATRRPQICSTLFLTRISWQSSSSSEKGRTANYSILSEDYLHCQNSQNFKHYGLCLGYKMKQFSEHMFQEVLDLAFQKSQPKEGTTCWGQTCDSRYLVYKDSPSKFINVLRFVEPINLRNTHLQSNSS